MECSKKVSNGLLLKTKKERKTGFKLVRRTRLLQSHSERWIKVNIQNGETTRIKNLLKFTIAMLRVQNPNQRKSKNLLTQLKRRLLRNFQELEENVFDKEHLHQLTINSEYQLDLKPMFLSARRLVVQIWAALISNTTRQRMTRAVLFSWRIHFISMLVRANCHQPKEKTSIAGVKKLFHSNKYKWLQGNQLLRLECNQWSKTNQL